MNTDSIIKVTNLSKSIFHNSSEIHILRDINFSICSGQIAVIAGNSGAGKSTLINILGLLDDKSSGSYFLFGKDTDSLSSKQKRNLRMSDLGFIFQNYNLLNYLTAYENVMLPLLNKRSFSDKRDAIVKRSLQQVGMEGRATYFPPTLSGGEQQRIAIARCIASNPQVILADEPTGNVDEENENTIIQLFKSLSNEGKTIIIVSHSDRIKSIADKLCHISHGSMEECI